MRKRHGTVAIGLISLVLLVSLMALGGCKGDTGSAGNTNGTISGVVTSATGTALLAGVTVTAVTSGTTATTDSSGAYSMSVPAGTYQLSFALSSYTSGSATAYVAAGTTTTINVTMAQAASGKPTVTIAVANNNIGFGNSIDVTASATDPNGDTISYVWTNATGSGTLATAVTPTLGKALGGMAAPSNDPGGYITAYKVEDRFGILPLTSDTRGTLTVTVKADDGKGQSSTASVAINAAGFQGGVKSVALGVPVYVNSGHADPSTWTITDPNGASVTATLVSYGTNSQRIAGFTPTVAGKYVVAEGANSMNIYAGTYAGAISGGTEDSKGNPSVVANSDCTGCHNDTTAPDEFTPWKGTLHSNFFARGLNGITSNNGTCLTCHTVGYDTAPASLADGGYYSKLTNTTTNPNNWQYPATRKQGNWATMWSTTAGAPQVAAMTNIQCESCHGPNNDDAHKTSSTTRDRVNFSAEVCAVCHASGTGHHIYSEWLSGGADEEPMHANLELALEEGLISNSSSTSYTSCARCHSAQGYSLYSDMLNAGNIGGIRNDNRFWDASTVEPQTCTACHDPHDATNPNQLRQYNNIALLPSGFGISGFGKGAMCASCHNTRNGTISNNADFVGLSMAILHEDADAAHPTSMPKTDGTFSNNFSVGTPHAPTQTDIYAGRNAFFMGYGNLPMLSKHANVEDTCVGCHMKLNPQTHLSHGAPETSGHVMFIAEEDASKVCANCHSANVGAEGIIANYAAARDNLASAMANALATRISSSINAGAAYVVMTDLATGSSTTRITIPSTNPVVSSTFGIYSSRPYAVLNLTSAITATYGSGASAYSKTSNSVAVRYDNFFASANVGSKTTNYSTNSDGNMVKAMWNFMLADRDKSKGIHNPSFVFGVLSKTAAQDLSK
ncbi:MAG: carboxypeptidase-like regulatory domain-containing protein [Nitrospiraceae bacterium]|nr:carboxypeptidase-like regulatory domain-containing protein [Nitrospiraceae bacterium]